MGADPSRICLELIRPERTADRDLLKSLVNAHRERGALVALDDLSGGTESLACLELLRPDIGKIDRAMTAGIQHSPARRRLVAALVECAHEQGCRVVAEGIERVDEFETMRELGVDLGQGFYFGQPTAKPMAVDPRLVPARAQSCVQLRARRGTVPALCRNVTCSPTSSACGARWTSCSATSSTAGSPRGAAAASRRPSTSTTSATRRGRSCAPTWPASTRPTSSSRSAAAS